MPDEDPDAAALVTDWWELEDVLCTSTARLKRGQTAFKMIGHDGPCLVLLHGAFGFSYIWQNLVRQLKDTGFACRMLLLDFYGRGHSPWPATIKECTISVLEQQVFDLVRALKIKEKIMLVGYDLGASVAACFGSKHPEYVAGIIQAGPRGILRPLDDVEQTVRGSFLGRYLFSFRGKQLLEDAHKAEFFDKKPGTKHWDLMDLHVRMIAWQLEHTPGYLTALASTVTHYPFHDSHAYRLIYGDDTLPFPMIVVCGDDDQLYEANELAKEIDRVPLPSEKISVIRMPFCGHNTVLEQADDVAGIIYDFLKVIGPDMRKPVQAPKYDFGDDAVIYVEGDHDEDHTQIFESIARAAKPPHSLQALETAIAFSSMIDGKGVLVERLHLIRNNLQRFQAARRQLAEARKGEDQNLLLVEAAIREGHAAFNAASESGASCYCEQCGGWLPELEHAESMLGSISRRKAEVDVMAFLHSPQEQALDALRRERVQNDKFAWIPTPAPSAGPSRESDRGSYTSVPAVPLDDRRQRAEDEERRRYDRRSQATGETVETVETVETGETGSSEPRRPPMREQQRVREGYRQERRSQVPSQETIESQETAQSGELGPPLGRRDDRRYDRRYDRRSQVPSQETVETQEMLDDPPDRTPDRRLTGASAEARRYDRQSLPSDDARRFDRRSEESVPELPPLPVVHVHYDFTQPVPVVETVDERARAPPPARREGSFPSEGHYDGERRRLRRTQSDRRYDRDDRRSEDRRDDDRRSGRSGSQEGRRQMQEGRQARSEGRLTVESRRRYEERERRHVSPKEERRYERLRDEQDDRRPPPRRSDDRRSDDRRSGSAERGQERRMASREVSREMSQVTRSRETRSMETKSRSRETRDTRSMETMSLEQAYDDTPDDDHDPRPRFRSDDPWGPRRSRMRSDETWGSAGSGRDRRDRRL